MKVKDLYYHELNAVREDASIARVIKIMKFSRLSTVFVVSIQNEYLGAITVSSLTEHCLPNYMKSLQSTAFMPNVDSLLENLKEKINLSARDLVDSEYPAIDLDDSVSHAADLMLRNNCDTLAVVHDGTIQGKIGKIDILACAVD